MIIVSHDRDLLDTAVDSILHLDGGKLTLYRGGYNSFERQRRERAELDAKFAKKQDAAAQASAGLRRPLPRQGLQGAPGAIAHEDAREARAAQPRSSTTMCGRSTFPEPAKPLSPPIIALDNVSVGYEPGKPVLRKLSLRIDDDDRIALLGANGNGKSTLAKLLAGKLAPMCGQLTRAQKLDVGYFAQHQLDELDGADSAYDAFAPPDARCARGQVRARAGAIGFSAARPIRRSAQLSGGEKARLLLGLATFAAPQLVMLDEPTNHLDIDSRAALIAGINDFPGAVILVSHDRYLIEACADRLWLVGNGEVKPFDGDLDDYRRLVLVGRRAGPEERARVRA